MDSKFWNRVQTLLDNKGFSRKELAAYAKYDVSNIGKGLANHNIPAADTAVLIAQFLDTTVEYLVTGQYSKTKSESETDLDTLYKFSPLIHKLSSLPQDKQDTATRIFSDICESYSK